jgi:CubicO group peptidase (beta-lactamase class C family)
MRIVKRILFVLLILISLIAVLAMATGNGHFLVAVQKTYLSGQTGPSINDFGMFTQRKVTANQGQAFPVSTKFSTELTSDEMNYLNSIETASLVVLKNDSLLFEKYFEPHTEQDVTNSFSMAKSFVSMAIGVVLNKGLITDIDAPAANYIPELKEKGMTEVTIRHLLQMSSGIGFDENYKNPLGYQAKVYYGGNLRKNTLAFDQLHTPGTRWEYLGGNTILLSLIVEKVSGQSLSDFFAENIWQKIGAESDAFWTIDSKNGIERASCCFYARALDFARLGQLYLNKGKWNGEQIIPEWFVEESIKPVMINNKDGEPTKHYGYQWWLGSENGDSFFQAQGILGQYIIVVPNQDLVIVRTGHKRNDTRVNLLPADLYEYIKIAKRLAL